jgi:hypothetical protein
MGLPLASQQLPHQGVGEIIHSLEVYRDAAIFAAVLRMEVGLSAGTAFQIERTRRCSSSGL